MDRTASRRQAELAARKREQGLRPLTVWVPENDKELVRRVAAALAAGVVPASLVAAALDARSKPPTTRRSRTPAIIEAQPLRDPIGRVTEVDRMRGRDPHDHHTPELPLVAETKPNPQNGPASR